MGKPTRARLRVKRSTPPGESPLPNILVYIELREHYPTRPALFALSEARRIARLSGASTFAVVASPPLATEDLEALAAPIGEAGADKLLLCESDDFADPPLDVTHGRALDAAVTRVPPMLVLFPAGGSGAALGPPLAARLGAAFAPWCDFLTTESEIPVPEDAGRVQLVYMRPDGRSRRRLDPLDLERPIVATLGAGRLAPGSGLLRNLEIEVIASVANPEHFPGVVKESVADPYAAFELASVLVLIADSANTDAGAHADGRPLRLLDVLSAGASPGVVVGLASEVPSTVLAACCPDVVLKIGASAAVTSRSARTRVVLVAPAGSPDLTPEDVDIVWQVQSPVDITPTALAGLLAALGDRA